MTVAQALPRRGRIRAAPRVPVVPGATGTPPWYQQALIYELHVRAFADSNGDGIGDFQGLTSRLDYLQDLGVTAIWLLPFYPSPLRDDGYDIADYTSVNPAYGTLSDFRAFVREAHARGLRVITELVCNHTSDQHAWFQRSRRAKPGSTWRDFYVWSDTADRYPEARIIFKDFETSNWSWDPVAGAYYWHRFYHHQPDLNFDHPAVHRQIFKALDFWLEMGVDGLRLDAVPYLYERDGTGGENLPETHSFLKSIRRHMDESFSDRLLLAEANQWPEEAIEYFGDGDECHMAFHFPLMPRMFMAVRMEDRMPIVDIMTQTPQIPETAQWALFLRNHDELTLEMVTDEERDYMYRVYAHDPQMRINMGIRRRLAPLLWNNRRRVELMNGLLFSLPGTPVIYYGDEIGMGDNIYLGDRDGVRTPMQWSGDRNAGFSQANRQRLYLPVIVDPEYHYEAVNVEVQQANPQSLLWWMKRLIALRKRHPAFGRGSLEFLHPENRRVLVFLRRLGDDTIMVVANLSRFAQAAEIDLSEFRGTVPVELFGATEFPPVGERPYFVTLGPHAFFWFSLERRAGMVGTGSAHGPFPAPQPRSGNDRRIPELELTTEWQAIFGSARERLEALLPEYLHARRWYGGKSRRIRSVHVRDDLPLGRGQQSTVLVLSIEYAEGDPETYVLPVAFVSHGDADAQLLAELPHAQICRLRTPDGEGDLVDAMVIPASSRRLLEVIRRGRRVKGSAGELIPVSSRELREAAGTVSREPTVNRSEQSNSSVMFGEELVLKLFRRLVPGRNPDFELGRHLTSQGFQHTAPVLGALEYSDGQAEPATLAIVHGFVTNQGDAWSYSLATLGRFLDRALTSGIEASDADATGAQAEEIRAWSEGYPELCHLLGRRTAELHAALAGRDDPAFGAEPFTALAQRSVYQSQRQRARRMLSRLGRELDHLPEDAQADAREVLSREEEIIRRLGVLVDRRLGGMRIRCHGDFHLGQVLFTGRDWVIIDLEGEPALSLAERRVKRTPLSDVAGMVRSFNYAASAGVIEGGGLHRPEDRALLEPWADTWERWASSAFLAGYYETASDSGLLPVSAEDRQAMLDVLVLGKALYELAYELDNRPTWVRIPLRGVLRALEPDRT